MGRNTDSFWDFSVSTYRQPGVAEACLSLQDRFGCDVNVLLYCCWFGRTRGLLDEPMFRSTLAFSQSWADQVVRPLRAARIWMKSTGCLLSEIPTDDCMALRDRIKAVELDAEHLQQTTLEDLATTPPTATPEPETQLTNTASNLRRYLERCDIRLDDSSLAELADIVSASIDGTEKETVLSTLNTAFQKI